MSQLPEIIRTIDRVSADVVAKASTYQAAILADVAGRRGTMHGRVAPVHQNMKVAGPAFTVEVRPGDNLMIHAAMSLARPGDVLVIDGNGCIDRALMGEIMKNVAMARGFAGVVLDGAIRDSAAFREDGFPCYARGVCHRGPYKDGPGEVNVPVSISGMVVQPGDIVVGDDDGVVFIAPHEAEAVAAASRHKLTEEATTMDAIARGAYDDRWIDATLAQKGVPL